jgi:type IV pilus assembly protein PilN
MIKVNLVPAEILAKAHQKQQIFQATVAGIALAIVVVLVSLVHYYKLATLQRQLTYDQSQLKKLEKIVAEVEELEKTAAAVRSRLAVITDLLKGRPLYPYFMSDFARSVPMGVTVKTLNTAGGGSAAAPLKLTIAAEARTNDDISGWVKRMDATGKFSNTELGAVTNNNQGAFGFTISTTYTPKL